jgi:hypothetical protein
MARQNPGEQLDAIVDAILGGRGDKKLAALASIAQDLRDLPRAGFKTHLRADLERRAAMTTSAAGKTVNPIREGFHSITPYLIVPGAAQLIDFMKAAFGAEERFRITSRGKDRRFDHRTGRSKRAVSSYAGGDGYSGERC